MGFVNREENHGHILLERKNTDDLKYKSYSTIEICRGSINMLPTYGHCDLIKSALTIINTYMGVSNSLCFVIMICVCLLYRPL